MDGYVIGIDPGLDGGIVVMCLDGAIKATHRMPTVPGARETMSLFGLCDVFCCRPSRPQLVCVEQVQPMGKANGAVGMAAIMKACGQIHGICHALSLPYEEVRPQGWQALLAGVPHPKAKRNATEAEKAKARKEWKAEIMKAAARRWPDADLIGSRHPGAKPSSGIADAAWIAEYARLRVVGTPKVREVG